MKMRFPPIRSSKFPPVLFSIILIGLLLASGVHTGFIVLMEKLELSNFAKTNIPILYWCFIASAVTAIIIRLMRDIYERPIKQLVDAAQKVASGDFSVYVPTIHTADKQDYMDDLIVDFNKMVEDLGSIETLKTDFFSNVSHEIKTPIAVIQNNAELLQKSALPEQQESIRAILQSTHRLSGLITNILKLNRLEKQVILPVPQNFDVSAQICECILQFEDRWEEKNITLDADIEDRVMVKSDEGLLEIVWTNLLSNALKFTQEGGTVSVVQTSGKSK